VTDRALRARLAVGLVCITPALAFASPAAAAIIGSCTIVIGAGGTLAHNPAITVLGSRQGGGASATATVTANSLVCSILNLLDCYSISAPAPAAFLTAPTGGDANVGFGTLFRLNGGADLPGNVPAKLANGTYSVTIDLTATRSAGIFPVGSYQAAVTLRCE
jgi:hypothetical protein